MDFCYQELSQLAAERRARLEESRRLWKFFWEMAEEVVSSKSNCSAFTDAAEVT